MIMPFINFNHYDYKGMKGAFLLLSAIAMTFVANAANDNVKVKRVSVNTPGTLQRSLNIDDIVGVKRVALQGTLNNDDVVWLRYMCGGDTVRGGSKAYITDIDLENVQFDASSGRKYFFKSETGETYGICSEHTLPPYIFFDTKIESIKLPSHLDSIAPYALSYNRLKNITVPPQVAIDQNAITHDSMLVSLQLPAMLSCKKLSDLGIPNLIHVAFGDIDYVSGNTFSDMPHLQTVVFDGRIGHIDGYQFINCPELESVTFNGPILTTGGALVAIDCPNLSSMTFNKLVAVPGFSKFKNCPKIDRIVYNGTPTATDYEALVNYEISQLQGKDFLKRMANLAYEHMIKIGRDNKFEASADRLEAAYNKWHDADLFKSKLQILRESAPYCSERDTTFGTFTYQSQLDQDLVATRTYYNVDSIAGSGNDISRIKNILYWIHDMVRHDGSSQRPECKFTIRDIEHVCKVQNRGVNCRLMAIMLTEALLSVGIDARYLTCMSKNYDEDNDCHVICIAWDGDNGKWVWADPTFCAYVTDENGTWLHPGEVRQRLIDGSPLMLNNDANWNHRSAMTKHQYLDEYMAKNLYIIESRMHQQAAPEGPDAPEGCYIALIPQGFEYKTNYSSTTTNDSQSFWSAPIK